MDALSEILKSVRLEGAVYLNAEFTAPWCVQAQYGLPAVQSRLPRAERVVFFHFVVEGTVKLPLAGGGVATATAGDLILFPQDARQVMASDVRLKPASFAGLLEPGSPSAEQVVELRYGGGGEATRLVCGFLGCSAGVCRPLLDALPSVLRVPAGTATDLVRDLLRTAVRETVASRPGAESLLAKLAELVFVEALRGYVESLPPENRGWLAGVRDRSIGRALAVMHREVEREWTVDDLAKEAFMSRSAFAERFAALVGEPPMQYLARWRLALAAQSLRWGDEAITRIAQRSGYDSDAAFSRAFKREFGMPPAAWRKAIAK